MLRDVRGMGRCFSGVETPCRSSRPCCRSSVDADRRLSAVPHDRQDPESRQKPTGGRTDSSGIDRCPIRDMARTWLVESRWTPGLTLDASDGLECGRPPTMSDLTTQCRRSSVSLAVSLACSTQISGNSPLEAQYARIRPARASAIRRGVIGHPAGRGRLPPHCRRLPPRLPGNLARLPHCHRFGSGILVRAWHPSQRTRTNRPFRH